MVIIAALFAMSGGIRVGEAFARAEAAPEPPAAEAAAVTQCEAPVHTGELLASLKTRTERLTAREAALADNEAALELARTAIDEKLAALGAAEEKLAATIAMADGAAEKDIARLVEVYENMKPKDAAQLFGEMDPEFAAGFLGRMRPDAAALVMAGLEPKTAYAISAVIAGRNALAPRN
jgi:flagellar motility protein MotE (MotC chaperone)